jgi:hypothetical protein
MAFDPRTRSPTLRALLKQRLAPVREKELLRKAQSPERPMKPSADECCGSGCKPCVMDLYREELKVWKECWVVWETEDSAAVKEAGRGGINDEKENQRLDTGAKKETYRMPGSFE